MPYSISPTHYRRLNYLRVPHTIAALQQYRHITLQEAIWLAEEHYQIEADYEIEEHMDWIHLQNGLREQWLELHRDYRNYQVWD